MVRPSALAHVLGFLALAMGPVHAGEALPAAGGPALGRADGCADVSLRTPVPPADPGPREAGVGLRGLERRGGVTAALTSDGRVYVAMGEAERFVAAPDDGGAWRALTVATDGVPVVVTTRGHVVVLESAGPRRLACEVPRSSRPVALPGSPDVLLGAENGSLRRLVRGEASPRLMDVVERGDEPVGAFAASPTRVVYARLDGAILSIGLDGRESAVIARPRRDVRAIRFVGERAFAAIGPELVALDEPAKTTAAPRPSDGSPDIEALAASPDGALLALLVGGEVEVRRSSGGTGVRTDGLGPREPTSIAWSDEGDVVLVATARDARPWRVGVDRGGAPTPTR